MMLSVKRMFRQLLMVVALFATAHGMFHSHAVAVTNGDEAASSVQQCVLCVTARNSISITPAGVIPPQAVEAEQLSFIAPDRADIAVESTSSRGPPPA